MKPVEITVAEASKETLLRPPRRRNVVGTVVAIVTALVVTNLVTAFTVQSATQRGDCSPDDELASTVFAVGGGWDMTPLSATKLVSRSTQLVERYLTSYGPPESGFVVASSETKIYKGGVDGARTLAYVLNTEVVNNTFFGQYAGTDGKVEEDALRLRVTEPQSGAQVMLLPLGLSATGFSGGGSLLPRFFFVAYRAHARAEPTSAFVAMVDDQRVFQRTCGSTMAMDEFLEEFMERYVSATGNFGRTAAHRRQLWGSLFHGAASGAASCAADGVEGLMSIYHVGHAFMNEAGSTLFGPSVPSVSPLPTKDDSVGLSAAQSSLDYSSSDGAHFWWLSQAAYQIGQRPSPTEYLTQQAGELSADGPCDTSSITEAGFGASTAWHPLAPSFTTVVADVSAGDQSAAAYMGALSGSKIVLVFRGTDNSDNDWQDMQSSKTAFLDSTQCPGCKVHSGFDSVWQSLRSQVIAHVAELKRARPRAELWLSGHSLGAAVATLAAADLSFRERMEVTGVYTFGEPRSANANFWDVYESRKTWPHWRVTHWKDPVPHAPAASMGFHHVGTEVFLDEQSTSRNTEICNGSGDDPNCAQQFGVCEDDLADHLNDHCSYYADGRQCGQVCKAQ